MELEGHPTQDIVDELLKRGATRFQRSEVESASKDLDDVEGVWIFLPPAAYQTGVDDTP